ncbi:DNA polymerase subunit Cdc27-domain-containing protein [Pilobolus umbonatus]|nr:DNA polymerase subunit Cdc27-domain-containing protein [Pilobolus umbonatus]
MEDCNDYLTVSVLQENKVVTYKALSRYLSVHVNTAKQLLYQFFDNNKGVHAIYCITGTAVNTNKFNIKLTKDVNLEEAKRGFKEISGVHVYSIMAHEPSDLVTLYAACKDIPKLSKEDCIQYGMIQNNHLSQQNTTTAPIATMKQQTIEKKTSIPTPVKPKVPAVGVKRKQGSIFDSSMNSTTKKHAVETEVKIEQSALSQSRPTPKRVNHQERTVKPSTKITLKAEDIFSDDSDNEETVEKPAEDVVMADIEPIDEDDEQKRDENIPVKIEEKEPSHNNKIRRKVAKKKTSRNARGLLVTEEVTEWEEVDAPETVSKPIEKKKATPQKTTSKKQAANKTAQTDLFSFWKKKE